MLTFGMCDCTRSLSKNRGIPSIEPDHRNHPDCPECGQPMMVYNLTALAEALVGLGRRRCAHNLAKEWLEGAS